jgi:D-alanyl-D-alanine carboxypeptidase
MAARRCREMVCPGAVLGVFRGNARPRVAAVGVQALGEPDAMHPALRMRIASVTKPFIATLVLRLVDDGRIALDDAIARHLPVPNLPGELTIRQVGRNRSGLGDPIRDPGFRELVRRDPTRVWTRAEVIRFALALPPRHEPGATFEYANVNTMLLAELVDVLEPGGLAAALDRVVTGPLSLDATSIASGPLVSPHPRAYRHGAADSWLGYGRRLYDVSLTNPSWTGGAGDMASTVADLGRAMRELARGSLLGDRGRAALLDFAPRPDLDEAYGFGISRRDGMIGHAGDVPGFSAEAWLVDDVVVVALANCTNDADGKMPARVLVDLLADAVRRGTA